jgi:C1A family cysteine protease
MFKIGGYKSSHGNVNCQTFSNSMNKFVKLAESTSYTYIIPEYTPISNQGSLGSCVANATADAFEIIKGIENYGKVEQVSRLFIYYNARACNKDTDKDSGCYIHDALNSLTKLGVCKEETWDYDTNKVFTHPPIEAYSEANDNKIKTFYQITSNNSNRINDIESAIRANHPVIFGTTVGMELQNYSGEDIVFDIPENHIGSHAMLIVGIRVGSNGKEFYIRNSWGDDWGDDGHFWMSSKYITWENTKDLFVPTRMEDFV